jgi:hypothetical protein
VFQLVVDCPLSLDLSSRSADEDAEQLDFPRSRVAGAFTRRGAICLAWGRGCMCHVKPPDASGSIPHLQVDYLLSDRQRGEARQGHSPRRSRPGWFFM